MKHYQLIKKFTRLVSKQKMVKPEDIGVAYTMVSKHYETLFLQEMHRYNDQMLDGLIAAGPDTVKSMVDLACGTGYNSQKLRAHYPDAKFHLVDISAGMLEEAKRKELGKIKYYEKTMLDFLRQVPDASVDMVVCSWAIKYQKPQAIIEQVYRILKPEGVFGVIVNKKDTLQEVRSIYPKLLIHYPEHIKAIMKELPNPKTKVQFAGWFEKAGFKCLEVAEDKHVFDFQTEEEMTHWVTHTGALAGFDQMLKIQDEAIQQGMATLFREKGIKSITHTFVWGVFKKEC